MIPLVFTAIALTLFTLTIESISWKLFQRKMDQMRFPTPRDPHESHSYYLDRLRIFTIGHASLLVIFIWVFCVLLW